VAHRSDMLTNAALEAIYRMREDLALAEAQLRHAQQARRQGEKGQALMDAHGYLFTAQGAATTAAQTALNAAQEAGREAIHR
jgi:hypothetical protein